MLRKILFRIARSRISSFFIGYTFEHLSVIMPLKRLYENEDVVVFPHPSPYWSIHLVTVPKKRIPAFMSLALSEPQTRQIVLSIFESLQTAADQLSLSNFTILVNGGQYQDVPQIHVHLISGRSLRSQEPETENNAPTQRPSQTLRSGSATACTHPHPRREFHAVISTTPNLPGIPALDLSDPLQNQVLFDMLTCAQSVVRSHVLEAYTLAVFQMLKNPTQGWRCMSYRVKN